jgi:hypothetical protein
MIYVYPQKYVLGACQGLHDAVAVRGTSRMSVPEAHPVKYGT